MIRNDLSIPTVQEFEDLIRRIDDQDIEMSIHYNGNTKVECKISRD